MYNNRDDVKVSAEWEHPFCQNVSKFIQFSHLLLCWEGDHWGETRYTVETLTTGCVEWRCIIIGLIKYRLRTECVSQWKVEVGAEGLWGQSRRCKWYNGFTQYMRDTMVRIVHRRRRWIPQSNIAIYWVWTAWLVHIFTVHYVLYWHWCRTQVV